MSKLKTEPKLIQWANDRFPPVSNDFILDNSTELIREYQELQQQNQDLEVQRGYWKSRCQAAEKYINLSPCDPDIVPGQSDAYYVWVNIANMDYPENTGEALTKEK